MTVGGNVVGCFDVLHQAFEQQAGIGQQRAFIGGQAGLHRTDEPLLALCAGSVKCALSLRRQRDANLAAIVSIDTAVNLTFCLQGAQQNDAGKFPGCALNSPIPRRACYAGEIIL
nr:hypothetical protein [Burkholderia ambifaria]